MKRAAHTRDEGMAIMPNKKQRIESLPSSPAVDCFAAEFETNTNTLMNLQLDETRHITGQVFMLWPMSNNTRKLQLKMISDSLDVVFEGPGLERLDFVSKDRLKLSLKGSKMEAKKAGSPHTLPVKLVFSNGTLVKFLKSEKRQEDKVVDLFKDIEDERRRAEYEKKCAEDDWFHPVPEPGELSETFYNGTILPSEGDSFPVASDNLISVTDHVSYPVVVNTSIHEPEDDEPAVQYTHRIGTNYTNIVYLPAAQVSTILDPAKGSSSQVPASPPASDTRVDHARRKKPKRIKKRDTRHVQNSIGSATPDIVSGTDVGEPKSKKPHGKKAKKQAATPTAEVVQTKHQSSSPHRDAAFDLVAGFHSERGGIYTPLGNVTPGASFSLVGVVTDTGPVKRTKTGDLSKSYTLVDPSASGYNTLTVNIFASQDDAHILPSANLNQVLLLRQIKCKEFYGKPQGVGYKDSFQWCGYDPTEGKHFYTVSSSQSKQGNFFNPSAAEMEYFVKLADWWRGMKEAEEKARITMMNDPSGNSTSYVILPKERRLHKLQTISELEPGTFVDCVIELLKVWRSDLRSDIYVTDYSENKYLQHNLDANASLLGRRTLKVSLWDGPNTMVNDLELHSLYLLKNMRLKKLDGSRIFLEGHIGYTDRGIYKLRVGSDQENLQELLSRKKEYERNPQHSRFELGEQVNDVGEPMQQGHDVPSSSRVHTLNYDIVGSSHTDQKLSTVEEVQRNNQCPNKFRVRARIIEYYPRRIEDFVTVECNDCHKLLDNGHHLCPECGDLTGKSISIRYQFALRIVDESGEKLNVNVSSDDADEFLIGLDPKDAREDVMALRKRLEPLLGHLKTWRNEFDEDAKAEGPFLDLCLKSWVPELLDESVSIRAYKLFGCKLQP